MKKTLLLLAYALATSAVQAQVNFAAPVKHRFNASAFKAQTVDLNRDQYPDIVVAGGGANVFVVLLNDQAGGFLPAQLYATGGFCSGVAATSLNCDAFADLLVSMPNDNQVQAFYGSAAGTFTAGATYATPMQPMDVVAADFNGDGQRDFAAVSIFTGQVSMHLNNGTPATCPSTFAAGVSYASDSGPLSASMLKTVDLNRDGRLDVVVVNSANSARKGLSVLFSSSTGTLSAPTHYNTGTVLVFDVAFADLDDNNAVDVIYPDPNNKAVAVLRGTTSAPFLGGPIGYTLSDAPLGIASEDFDGDGKRDVATVLRNGKIELLLGTGTGTLATPVTMATVPDATWLLAADFNLDGKQDIAVVGSGSASVLLSQPTVVLSNQSAIAARALSLYPNPSTGTFQLDAAGQVQIYDLTGRPVAFQRTGTSVTLPGATPGLYVIELTTRTERSRQTLLIE